MQARKDPKLPSPFPGATPVLLNCGPASFFVAAFDPVQTIVKFDKFVKGFHPPELNGDFGAAI